MLTCTGPSHTTKRMVIESKIDSIPFSEFLQDFYSHTQLVSMGMPLSY